ncbi:MAG: hypothetical protein AAF567_08325 [Actinomycetota bacterium]
MIDGLCNESGRIGVLAIDHRDSLRAVIAPDDPAGVGRDEIVSLKREIITGLADAATGVMLEPEYSIPDLVGILPEGVGFTAALESQGYSNDPSGQPTELLEGWSAAQAAASGAAATKLLAYYSPAAEDHAEAQRRVITEAIEQSHAAGLPLLLEPLAFPGGEHGPDTIAAVSSTVELGADLMKVAWPGFDHLDALVEALDGRPWVLLSGGGDFEDYLAQVEAAVERGCVGFMAGRAVWREASVAEAQDRGEVLAAVARSRLERLRAVID